MPTIFKPSSSSGTTRSDTGPEQGRRKSPGDNHTGITSHKPTSTPTSGESHIYDLEKSRSLHGVSDDAISAAEPIAPTTTMHFAVKPMPNELSVQLERPSEIHTTQGLFASFFNMEMPRHTGHKTYLEEFGCIGWSHHPDEAIIPHNDHETSMWSYTKHNVANRYRWIFTEDPSIQNTTQDSDSHNDACDADALNKAMQDHLSSIAVCCQCGAESPNMSDTYDAVIKYCANIRSDMMIDELGHASPEFPIVRANPNRLCENESMRLHHPSMLVCRFGHVTCASCLIQHWTRAALHAAYNGSPSWMTNLKCPCSTGPIGIECPCFFSLRVFWPFIYAQSTMLHFKHLIKYNVILASDAAWFLQIWIPIMYYSKRHWHRRRKCPTNMTCTNLTLDANLVDTNAFGVNAPLQVIQVPFCISHPMNDRSAHATPALHYKILVDWINQALDMVNGAEDVFGDASARTCFRWTTLFVEQPIANNDYEVVKTREEEWSDMIAHARAWIVDYCPCPFCGTSSSRQCALDNVICDGCALSWCRQCRLLVGDPNLYRWNDVCKCQQGDVDEAPMLIGGKFTSIENDRLEAAITMACTIIPQGHQI